VFGAGEGGAQVITAMLRDPASPYLPVALLDDDPSKRSLRIMGIPVVGPREQLSRAVAAYQADALLIAIPSAGSQLIATVAALARDLGLPLKVLPPVGQLFGVADVSDIRNVTTADLLGRTSVDTDLAAVAGYLTGKRVLVTGAGGSIGSELCREISLYDPSELIMVDRDESGLHGTQLIIENSALLDSPGLVLADLRDRNGMEKIFAERRPHVVFHAAALKHLPLLERHPSEAVKTNVWGTLWLLELAEQYGVERFVNISTDKAATPPVRLGTPRPSPKGSRRGTAPLAVTRT